MNKIRLVKEECVEVRNTYTFDIDEDYVEDIKARMFKYYDCINVEDRINALTVEDIYNIYNDNCDSMGCVCYRNAKWTEDVVDAIKEIINGDIYDSGEMLDTETIDTLSVDNYAEEI